MMTIFREFMANVTQIHQGISDIKIFKYSWRRQEILMLILQEWS